MNGRVGLLLVITTVALACTVPTPGFEPGVAADGSADVQPPDQSRSLDRSPGSLDGGRRDRRSADSSPLDAGAADAPPPPPPPPPSGLGSLCTGTCPATDEICVYTDEGASVGICLRECDAPDTFCQVPDPFVAGCAVYFNPDVGSVTVCVIFCRFKKDTFPCPDQVNYRCKEYANQMGICVPK